MPALTRAFASDTSSADAISTWLFQLKTTDG